MGAGKTVDTARGESPGLLKAGTTKVSKHLSVVFSLGKKRTEREKRNKAQQTQKETFPLSKEKRVGVWVYKNCMEVGGTRRREVARRVTGEFLTWE